ncbi:unnamed protein product [Nippostrongylus brasiliensis]|uniref:Endo/exonuclease/phosphatase domain-containing protein n=1 Tax=Nippostrongylus brasiliensis TaxID=27835 RepID=A0A0N4XFX7_NIPBR|nr:unnamed protein product [Nippostrongylus brasiliensis]
MKIIVVTEETRLHFFTAYAPQTGCSEEVKDEFWALLHEKTAEVPSEEMVVVAGDLNGHAGITKDGFKCHGGFGYGTRNEDYHKHDVSKASITFDLVLQRKYEVADRLCARKTS